MPAALAFTAVWFVLLWGRPLYDPDEGRYAEIPREILSNGDWLIPHLDGLVYLEKPPLQYWLSALSLRLFGEGEASARLWTGLFGYLTLAVVAALARHLWGSGAAIRAWLLLSGSVLFVLLGHQLTLDMTLCFWLVASLACFIVAQSGGASDRAAPRWMLGCWATMALAVLTKGLIGVLIPGTTLAIYVLWQRDGALLRRLNFVAGLGLMLVMAAPWFVLASRANPEFLQFFFIREHFQRFLTPIEERSEPWWFFIPVLFVGVLPWVTQAARALALDWRGTAPRGQLDAVRLLWIWSVFVLLFFSASNAKLIPYILPALPTLALLVARPAAGERRGHLVAGAAFSAVFALGILAYASALWVSPRGLELALRLRPALWPLCAALVTGAGGCLWHVRRGRPVRALAALSAGWFGAVVALTVGACIVADLFSARDLAGTIARQANAGAPVFSVQNYQQSLPFYLRRTVTLVDYRDEFTLGLREAPDLGIPDLAAFAVRWGALPDALAVMPRSTRERLDQAGVPMREIACFPTRLCLMSRH